MVSLSHTLNADAILNQLDVSYLRTICYHGSQALLRLRTSSPANVCNEQTVLAGHKRKLRPAMYLQAWTSMCDLVLIGDLIASSLVVVCIT